VFLALGAAFGLLGLLFLVTGALALRRGKLLGTALDLAAALLLIATGALCGTIAVATRGYDTLTREEVAVVVEVEPSGARRFQARFSFPDGRERRFGLAGDALYVDAHILKWKPIANLLGLHTAYELDRVAGRYASLDDERTLPRSVFSLGVDKPVDLFDLRTRFSLLRFLVDAEYGSASFVVADEPASFEVRVSTTGLLIRRAGTRDAAHGPDSGELAAP
jgi:hypothetical protein